MSEDKVNVPKIRFPGFTGAWEQRELGEISDIRTGPFGSTLHAEDYVEEGTPIITTEHFKTGRLPEQKNGIPQVSAEDFRRLKSYVLKIDDIVFSRVGSVDINALITPSQSGWLYSGRVLRVRTDNNIDSKYLHYELSTSRVKKDVIARAVGQTMPSINTEILKQTKVFISTEIKEQQDIGQFFATLDSLITLHQRKLNNVKNLKAGLLQKIFPRNGEVFPEVRFPGFTDAWEQRKLGDVSERVRGNDGRMDLPTLTISAGNGWLDQRERFSGNIAGNEQKNYTLLTKGELSYNHGNSKLAKYGTVFVLRTYEEALVPRVYHSFKTTKEASADFIEYMFSTKIPDRELAKLISSGARMDGLLNINYDEFMSIKITVPKVEEQMKIAKFLRILDDTITLHQQKLEHLQQLKKALLQQMFV